MFRRLQDPPGRPLTFTYQGEEVDAVEGDTVAAALMAAGEVTVRTAPSDGSPRAPYCLMGVCFECLVEIDGVTNQQSCLVPVRPGMIVARQEGAVALSGDE
jgi:predicted molibdopterin-dependent oxidoreductase YjgC